MRGLLIQTKKALFFVEISKFKSGGKGKNLELSQSLKPIRLCDEGAYVSLEMIRGVTDSFYFAQRDSQMSSDILIRLRFELGRKED